MKILRGHDVGGRLRPVLGDLDVALLEDGLALLVLDAGGAQLPINLVKGMSPGLGKKTFNSDSPLRRALS